MNERIEQRPTRREVLPYNGIQANNQLLCPEFLNPLQYRQLELSSQNGPISSVVSSVVRTSLGRARQAGPDLPPIAPASVRLGLGRPGPGAVAVGVDMSEQLIKGGIRGACGQEPRLLYHDLHVVEPGVLTVRATAIWAPSAALLRTRSMLACRLAP